MTVNNFVASSSGTIDLNAQSVTAIKLSDSSKINDSGGNELITFPAAVASAVNNIKISNAATGGNPSIVADGEDVGIAVEGVLCKNGNINDVETITRASGVLDINGVGGMTLSTNNATRWTIAAGGNLSSEAGIDFTVAGKFGCNGATAQAAVASGGALAAFAQGSNGLDTGAHMEELYNLVVAMRAALVANGIMS